MKPFPCRFIIYAAFNIFNLSSSSILQLLASISKWSTDKTSSLHHSFTNVSIQFYLILMVAHICHQTECPKNQCLEVSRSSIIETAKISDHSLLDQTSKTWFKFFKLKPIKISTRKHQQMYLFSSSRILSFLFYFSPLYLMVMTPIQNGGIRLWTKTALSCDPTNKYEKISLYDNYKLI